MAGNMRMFAMEAWREAGGQYYVVRARSALWASGFVGFVGCAVNLTCLPSSLSKVNDSMTV